MELLQTLPIWLQKNCKHDFLRKNPAHAYQKYANGAVFAIFTNSTVDMISKNGGHVIGYNVLKSPIRNLLINAWQKIF